MKVENKLRIFQIDGVDVPDVYGEKTALSIRNVWNRKYSVELQIGDGKKVVVLAADLEKAISNATNNND